MIPIPEKWLVYDWYTTLQPTYPAKNKKKKNEKTSAGVRFWLWLTRPKAKS